MDSSSSKEKNGNFIAVPPIGHAAMDTEREVPDESKEGKRCVSSPSSSQENASRQDEGERTPTAESDQKLATKLTDLTASERSEQSHKIPGAKSQSFSDSSSVAGVGLLGFQEGVDTKDFILNDKSARKDTNSLGVNMVQIPTSDTASMGSIASNLESVGAATLAEQRLHAAQNAAAATNKSGNAAVLASNIGDITATMGDQDMAAQDPRTPQHIHTNEIVTQGTPVLVAVPLQQHDSEMLAQTSPQNQTNGTEANHTAYATSAQQTLLYQIPGVMALPDGAGHVQGHSEIMQQPLQTINHQGQVVGMVGAIPVVKLQGGSVHMIKKKKGRFKFLQESPAPAGVARPGTSTNDNAGVQAPVPSDIAVPQQNPSTNNSIVSQLSTPVVQQSLDPNVIPKVKKKGRFMVTSVKDPIPKNIQTQNPPPTVGPLDVPPAGPTPPPSHSIAANNQNQISQSNHNQHNVQTQQQHQQTDISPQNHSMSQPYLIGHQQSVSQPQQFVAHLSFPTSFGTQILNSGQYTSTPGNMHVENNQASQFQQGSGIQQAQPAPLQRQRPSSQSQHLQGNDRLASQHVVTDKVKQQPAYNGVGPTGAKESPGKRRPPVSIAPPNIPIPKPPSAQQPIPPKKSGIQKRAVKGPQAIGSNGMYGNNVGLGKLSYFLDQMKSEVTDADRMIRHLQTDMKLMRDKNKELEAKAREMERKLKEETSLREKAESRCLDLRKKLRAAASNEVNITTNKERTEGDIKVTKEVDPNSKDEEKKCSIALENLQSPAGIDETSSGLHKATNASTNLIPKKVTMKKDESKVPDISFQENGLAKSSKVGTGVPSVPVHAPSSMPMSQRGTILSDAAGSAGAALGVKTQKIQSESASNNSSDTVEQSKKSDTIGKIDLPVRQNDAQARISQGNRRPDVGMNTVTPPHTPQQRPPVIARASTTPQKSTSLDSFDPLRQGTECHEDNDVYPVISFPTNVSLGTVPVNAAHCDQQSEARAYSTSSMPVMGNNPYVFPIAFGMTSTNMGTTQTEMPNGFNVQQPYVFQQPIMFQQVQSQQIPHPQQQSTRQEPVKPEQTPANPFDPY